LLATGIKQVVAVNLTRLDFEIPVVKVVIPGLEWDHNHPNYAAGRRAQQASGRSE
jgi:ribosomal protein S12 methylthiotransferase accessory factor